MAHELIDSVTATPAGPVTVGLGGTLDIAASFTLNGASPGSPTTSTYTIQVSKVVRPGVYATVIGTPVSPATAGTDYTMTIPTGALPLGTITFVATSTLTTDAPHFQIIHSNEITVHVVQAREIEADLPGREVVAGLPSREVEGSLPSREVVAGLPSREIEAELPSRTLTTGMP